MSMEWNSTLPIIIASAFTIVGGIIGYFLKYYLDKKARFSSENAAIRRKMYENYTNFMMGFIDNLQNQTGDLSKSQISKVLAETKKFHRLAISYSTPHVINAFADFLQYSYKHPDGDGKGEYTMVLVTNLFKEMRRDIGLSSRGLKGGAIRLIRPIINDYDEVIAPTEYSLINDAKKEASSIKKGAKK